MILCDILQWAQSERLKRYVRTLIWYVVMTHRHHFMVRDASGDIKEYSHPKESTHSWRRWWWRSEEKPRLIWDLDASVSGARFPMSSPEGSILDKKWRVEGGHINQRLKWQLTAAETRTRKVTKVEQGSTFFPRRSRVLLEISALTRLLCRMTGFTSYSRLCLWVSVL